jgi:GDP-L-fucose synthase
MKDPFPTSGIPYYKDKRVVVTGASGLIGSYAVKLLKESGATVYASLHVRPPNEFTAMANKVGEWDFRDPKQVSHAVTSADVVIGCAGITGGVNLPKLDPVSYVGPATAMIINTLHACFEEKVPRFGYLSSTTVYAPSESPVKEDDVLHSDKLYPLYRGIGHSKRFCEKLCAYYHDTTGIGVGVVRPAGAYGRFDNFDEKSSHVLPGMVNRAFNLKQGEAFEVWGDGEDVRDFIHAQDVARCLLLATALKADADPINVASGTGISTARLAQTVLNAVNSDAKLTFRPDKPSALKSRLVDVSKAERLLGFTAEISLAEGISDVVAWRRETA